MKGGTRAGSAFLPVMALSLEISLSPDELQVMKNLTQHREFLLDLRFSLLLRYIIAFSQLEHSLFAGST